MSTTNKHNELAALLSITADHIKISNKGFGYYDVNKYAEVCMARILEIIYQKEFIVLETEKVNYPAVDLGAADNSMFVQVTSDASAEKIKSTFKTIIKNGKYNEYKNLYFIFLVSDYSNRLKNENFEIFLTKNFNGKVTLNDIGFDIKKSIIDFTRLGNIIKNQIRDVGQLEHIISILREEYSDFKFRSDISNLPVVERISKSLNKKLSQKSNLDAINEIAQYFAPALVIPPQLILKIYPFNKPEIAELDRFILLISDNELYKDICSLFVIDEALEERKKFSDFFRFNGILHISLYGSKKSFTIPIYDDGKTCNCERCSINRLSYSTAVAPLLKLRVNKNFEALEFPLRTAFVAIKLGDYVLAKQIYLYEKQKHKESSNFIHRYLIELGLYHLHKWYGYEPSEEGEYILRPSLVASHFALQGCDEEKVDFLFWLDQMEYLEAPSILLEGIHRRSKEKYIDNQYGDTFPSNLSFDLVNVFSKVPQVISGNLLSVRKSRRYQDFLLKSIETFYYTHEAALQAGKTTYGAYFIDIWIKECDPMAIRQLFWSMPHISFKREAFAEPDTPLSILFNIENLVTSLDSVLQYQTLVEQNDILDHIYRVLENTMIIGRRIELLKAEAEDLSINICSIARRITNFSSDVAYQYSFFLSKFFDRFDDGIKQKLFDDYLEIRTLKEYVRASVFKKFDLFSPYFKKSYDSKINSIAKSLDSDGMGYELPILLDDYDHLSMDQKTSVKELVQKALSKRVTPYIVYSSVMKDIIGLDPYFDGYILDSLHPGEERYYAIRNNKNPAFDHLLEMFFYLDKDTSILRKIMPLSPYYEWLIDIDNYDYTKFDHSWILRNQGEIFVKRYRESKRLLKAVLEGQRRQMIEGVSWMYFNKLV